MLSFNDFDADIAKKVLSTALENGGSFADVFVEDSVKSSISWSKNKADDVLFTNQAGVGIRVIDNGCVGYSFCDGFSLESVLLAAKKAGSIAKSGNSINTDNISFPNGIQYAPPLLREKPATNAKFDDKLQYIIKGEEGVLSAGKEIILANIIYRDWNRKFKVFNSEGIWVEENQNLLEYYVFAIAQKGEKRYEILRTAEGDYGLELFDEVDLYNLGREAGNTAIEFLSAKAAPAGSMPVIMANGENRCGVLIHEAIGHALEIDFIEKKTSVYSELLNKQVASPLVTVVDDATLNNRPGSFTFDDEGTLGQRKELIKDGILRGYITDYKGAKLTGFEKTGNGRRESFRYPTIPRMTCTFIDNGNDNPDDMIKDIKKGLYVKSLGGGQGDLSGAGFVFNVSEAYMIKNGKITYPVYGATLTGTGLEVLGNIYAIGNDLELEGAGRCGKFQNVPVSTGQPSIAIKSMIVGGSVL